MNRRAFILGGAAVPVAVLFRHWSRVEHAAETVHARAALLPPARAALIEADLTADAGMRFRPMEVIDKAEQADTVRQ